MYIGVVIPVYNRKEITLKALRILSRLLAEVDYSFVIIDDGSTDGTSTFVRRAFPDAVILKGDGGLWWSGAVEMGRSYCVENGYSHILLLNDDLDFAEDFMVHLLSVSQIYSESLIGALKLNSQDTESILVSGYMETSHCQQIRDVYAGCKLKDVKDSVIRVDALPGSTLLMPCSVAIAVGGFDLKRFPHNFGDIEYTLRATKKGYSCYVATGCHVYTVPNTRYLSISFDFLSRTEFIKNLFNRYKYNYGFIPLYYKAYMHKTFACGTYWLLRSYGSLLIKISKKMIFGKVYKKVIS